MGLEVVLLLLSEPALLDALVVGVLGLEVDAPAALQGAAIVRLGLLGIAGEELALAGITPAWAGKRYLASPGRSRC